MATTHEPGNDVVEPRSRQPDVRSSAWRWLAVPTVALIVIFGVYVTGALVTDDETIAKGLTGLWLLAAGLAALYVGWRNRPLALPVIGTYVVVAGALGGFLLYTSTVNRVVNEDVIVAVPADPKDGGQQASEDPQPEPGPVEVARGNFVDGAHPTTGLATIIDTPSGERVVTLTNFRTDPGPDLRVYVVPRGSEGVSGGVDVGALKGNEGDQQYDVPRDAPIGKVVIWCRAFSVNFGTAQLS